MPGPSGVGSSSDAAARAEQLQRQAEIARERARAAQEQARAAQERVQSLESRAHTAQGPAADRLRDRFERAQDEANQLKDTAVERGDQALAAQRAANDAARQAGLREPFALANQVRDTFDAASLDTRAQERLFGTRTVVSQVEAAQADARQIQAATDRGPAEGAAELRRQLEASDDPVYRQALASAAGPQVERISQEVNKNDGRPDEESLQSILRDLSESTRLAGPEGGRQIANSFARHMVDNNLDIDDEDQFGGALRKVIREGASPLFGQLLPQELAALNRAPEAQEEIAKATQEGIEGKSGGGFLQDAVDGVEGALKDGAGWIGDRANDALDLGREGLDRARGALSSFKDMALGGLKWGLRQVLPEPPAYPTTPEERAKARALIEREYGNEKFSGDARTVLDDIRTAGVDPVDAWFGSHVEAKDDGLLYEKWRKLATAEERSSSHKADPNTPQYEVDIPGQGTVLFGKRNGQTWFQFENSGGSTPRNPGDVPDFITHQRDWLIHFSNDYQNVGPLGLSPRTEKRGNAVQVELTPEQRRRIDGG